MFSEQSPDMGSNQEDVEKFVADKSAELEQKLAIDPLTHEDIDQAEKQAGEREASGL